MQLWKSLRKAEVSAVFDYGLVRSGVTPRVEVDLIARNQPPYRSGPDSVRGLDYTPYILPAIERRAYILGKVIT